jgi:hypothetical protein
LGYGGAIAFSDLLKTASYQPNIQSGCFVDTSILFAASYPPDEFNTEAEEIFEFMAEIDIPVFTNVNVRSEFIDQHRRVMIPEGLGDLYSKYGKKLDSILYSKLQSVNTSLTNARNTGKSVKFNEEQIKTWRRTLLARQIKDKDGWLQFCSDFLQNRIEAIWDQTCEELGVNFLTLRNTDQKSDWITGDINWKGMASIVGRFGIGSFDAMIINLFLNSKFPIIITADREFAYVINAIKPDQKFVCIPDKLIS